MTRLEALEAVAEAARVVSKHLNIVGGIPGWIQIGTALHALDTLPANPQPGVGETEKSVDALLAENARLREALDWYADARRYNGHTLEQAAYDSGYRARAALKETTP